MELFGQHIAAGTAFFLFLALFLALSFEFVNGFHDTANAVATVIYTRSLKPIHAVIWSGCWNLIGVLVSAGAVAYGIVALLPSELVLNVGSDAGFAMVFALLISAIIWNVGTWFLGLPASSSHTLIGSILGVGLANALMNHKPWSAGVNWGQVQTVFTGLIISPLIGFAASALLLVAARALIKNPELFIPPDKGGQPPRWVKGLLILTCTGVSFTHGSNDGQKGMGLIMLIMIGVIPGAFALQMGTSSTQIAALTTQSRAISTTMQAHDPGVVLSQDQAGKEITAFLKSSGKATPATFAAIAAKAGDVAGHIDGKASFDQLPTAERVAVRRDMYQVSDSIAKLDKGKVFTDKAEDKAAVSYQKDLDKTTKFIPVWVKVIVAFALGIGTMIGWKRIVVTVGEKIGKQHLTYAQGASAELVAMGTIGLATQFGMPVSTTHVLSSGIAGTMFASKSGLQAGTLRNILLAWVLTLPVCVLLGAGTFSAAIYFVLHVLHSH